MLRKTPSVLLFLVWGAVFHTTCAAAPLMVERNLFAPDRKPPSPDLADTSVKGAKPGVGIGNIQLDGVMMQNNVRRAILRIKGRPAGDAVGKGHTESPYVTVREGQTVSDYKVSKIELKSISLEKDGQTFTVGLFAENKVITPPSPVAAPAAPAPAQQPPGVPGAAPQGNSNQQPGVQQAGQNPQIPPQPIPNHMARPGAVANPAHNRNTQPQAFAPPPEQANQDPSQAAEPVDEEE